MIDGLDPLIHTGPSPIEDRDQQSLLAAEVFHQLRFAGAGFTRDRHRTGVFVSILSKEPLGGPKDSIVGGEFPGHFHHFNLLPDVWQINGSNTPVQLEFRRTKFDSLSAPSARDVPLLVKFRPIKSSSSLRIVKDG